MGDAMDTSARRQRTVLPVTATIAVVASMAFTAAEAVQQPAAAAKPVKGVVIRGCLAGSELRHIDTDDSTPTLPDTLRVSSIRVIRSQLKALDGHQVELIGTLRGIPGQENGLLVVDSDKGRFYIGGGDPRLGDDLNIARMGPPTMYAHTVKDIAPACTAGQSR
jgi:hypothetical protein